MKLFEADMIQIYETVIRGFISLVVLFLSTKMMGKKQISELSLFDYVMGISIGNFAAEITTNIDNQFINGIVAIILFGVVAFTISKIAMKSITLRKFFMGVPTVLIEHGKLMESGLRKVKIDVNDLLEECRINGYFDISEIEYAVMEANGKVSILPNGENKPLTIKDMKLKPQKQGLCANVIIDGKIIHKNLKNVNKDEKWLEKELKINGKKYEDILLATVDINEKITFYMRNTQEEALSILE